MGKSKLYGVGIRDPFMEVTTMFLDCNGDSVPFKFLGINVGCNPRRVDA